MGKKMGLEIKGHDEIGYYGIRDERKIYVNGEAEIGNKYEIELTYVGDSTCCGDIVKRH